MTDDVQAELAAMKHELHRLRAVTEIQNLMGTYTVNHIPKNMHDHVELFAMEMDDVSVEVGNRGKYVGPDAVRELYGQQFKMDLKGNLLIHYLATPMITVAGDGKTAKAVWRSPGIEAVHYPGDEKPTPLWSFGSYAADFIYLSGRWKIWHLHWIRNIKCRVDPGWVEDLSFAFDAPPPPGPNMEATKYHNPYTPDSVQDSIPPCPEPYETFDDPDWGIREQILGPR